MSPEERDEITTSFANLWSFNGIFIANLLSELRRNGLSEDRIEELLQTMDEHVDAVLQPPGQVFATGLLAAVRARLANEPD